MILAIKTSDNTTQLWLFDPAATPGQPAIDWESGRALSEQLLGRITELIESHHHQLQDVRGIIIFSGPGSFTSLRIGHTVANALADSLGIPIVGTNGDNWLDRGIESVARDQPTGPALPHYGAEAHITKPKS